MVHTFTMTMLAPVGMLNMNETSIPTTRQKTEIRPAVITNPLKLLTSLLAITAGKIIRPDINKVPIILIPTTTVNAVRKDMRN